MYLPEEEQYKHRVPDQLTKRNISNIVLKGESSLHYFNHCSILLIPSFFKNARSSLLQIMLN